MKLVPVFVLFAIGALCFAFAQAGAQAPPDLRYTDATLTFPDGSSAQVDVLYDAGQTDATGARQKVARQGGAIPSDPFVLTGFRRFTIPVPFHYNPTGLANAPTDHELQVANGHHGWNSVTPNFSYRYDGLTPSGLASNICTTGRPSGENVVNWGPLDTGVLAVACWSSADECDIVIGTGWNWASSVDLQTVMLHESGHCAGLGHSPDRSSVMYASYQGVRRQPAADDVAGICMIYGCGATATPTTSTPTRPTATPTASNTPTPTMTATPTAGPCEVKPCVRLFPGWNLLGRAPAAETPREFADRHDAYCHVDSIYEWDGVTWRRWFHGLPDYTSSIAAMRLDRQYWVHCT